MPSTQKSTQPPSRILLIEDDLALGDSLRDGLKPDQVDLATAESTESALERLGQEHFDLVLLDLGLPGSDGFELLESLKSDDHLRETPIIILTANNAVADKVRAFDLGAVDYVTKPFELVELRARVRSALSMRRLQRALIAANHKLDSARAAAEEAAESKGEFLATMSHEIRTPMNGVIAMTGLLMQTDLAADQRDFVETIRSSGESLLTIIDDILHFSKIESGKMELELRPMDLRQCSEEILDLLAARAAEKGLDLVLEIDALAPAQVIGDATRIRQILLNLVNNAIKFTAAGSVSIHITSRPTAEDEEPSAPREFLISVRDTGIGIPADKIARLFRSFSQVDSSINRQYGGTGLGLAISKGLVELMGGRVWVESTEGTGSTFHFTLLLPEVAASQSAAPTPLPSGLVGQRVLIVEDGAVNRAALEQQFQRWGAKTVAVAAMEQALAEVAKVPGFALAVIDCQLPGNPGARLASELRKVRNHHSLPIILLNTVGSAVEGTDSLSGQWTTVGKPIKQSQLLPAIHLLLSGSAAAPARKAQVVSKMDSQLAARLPLRILLTDDNVINQKVAVRLLQQMGYKADTAGNGHEALRAIEQKGYDVILMDVQMPEMDGLEATRQIRARQKENSGGNFSQPMAIIAMTANAMQGDREKCLAAGMDDYLPKPVRPEALQAMLEKHGQRIVQTAKQGPVPEAEAGSSAPSAVPILKVVSPPPAEAIIETPPVDMERLNDFAGGSQENYNELVGLYLKQTSEQLEQIRASLTARDAEATSRVAHSCAGASATCGMLAIVPLLRQVEHLTQDKKIEAAAGVMPQVDREFERLKHFLENQKPIALAG